MNNPAWRQKEGGMGRLGGEKRDRRAVVLPSG